MLCVIVVLGLLLCLLPISSIPVFAAAPSVEDILNDYHQKAFTAQIEAETQGASAYDMRSGPEQNLEQETIDTLNAAGYEAYHVTSDNYYALEELLQTDFAELGLNPEGSYLIVISGEESTGSNSRIRDPITPALPTEPGGDGNLFEYTYNGKKYTMHYVTVTATDNSHFRQVSDVNLNEKLSPDSVANIVGQTSSVVGLLTNSINVEGIATLYAIFDTPVTISLLLWDLLPNYEPTSSDLIRMTGCSIWTVKYTQVYNYNEGKWCVCAGVEYVTMQKYVDYHSYNSSTGLYDIERVHYDNEIIPSAWYNDTQNMKQIAAIAYEYGQGENYYLDKVEKVEFKYGQGNDQKTVLTHYRTIYDDVDSIE